MTIPVAVAPLVERIGWLLVHSVWQFALLALLLAIALRVLRRSTSSARYAAALVGWSLMLAAPALTWPLLPAHPPAAIASAAPATPAGVPPSGGHTIADSDSTDDRTPAMALAPVGVPPSGGRTSIDSEPAQAGTPTSPTWIESLNAAIAPWLNTLVVIWCIGVCIFAARSARGWHIVRQLLHRDVQAVPDEMTSLLVRVLKRVGLQHRVRLLQSPHVDVPLVVGWLRPVILLPVCVATGFLPQQLEAILAHELAHIRRHDYLINLLQTLSETVFFYHPALWWASAVIRREREHCCDELAARALGNRAEYGRALLALEELRGETPALALGAKGGSLLERIRRLAQREPTPRLGAGGVLGVALVAVVVVTATVIGTGIGSERTAASSQEQQSSESSDSVKSADTATPDQPFVSPDPNKPFVVHGRITDEQEQPLAGVVVSASTGIGTLFRTGTATTAADGTYTLHFGPGLRMQRGVQMPLGVGFQAATISPHLDGWYEVNLHQQGNLGMSDAPRDITRVNETNGYKGVVRPDTPYEVNFVMARGATIEGRFLNEFGRPVVGESVWLDGEDLPPSSSVLASVETNDHGEFRFTNVPLNRDWHFTVRIHGTRAELSGQPLRFERAEQRTFELTLQTTETDDSKAEFRLEQTEKPARESTDAPAQPAVPMTTLRGTVVDETGRPAVDSLLEAQFYSHGRRNRVTATSGADGGFEMQVPTKDVDGLPIVAASPDGRRMGIVQIPSDQRVEEPLDLKMTLKDVEPVQVVVVDAEGRHVPEAMTTFVLNWSHVVTTKTDNAGIASFLLPVDAEVHSLHAWKDGLGLDYKAYFSVDRLRAKQPQVRPDLSQPVQLALTGVSPLTVTLLDAETDQPVPESRVYVWLVKKPGEPDDLNVSGFADELGAQTDRNGQATINWLPVWRERQTLTIWASVEGYDRQRGMYKHADGNGALTMRLNRLVPLSGRVTLPDGSPAPDIALEVAGDGYTYDNYREHVTTDADGRYSINVSPNQAYIVVVQDRKWAAPAATGFVVLPGQSKEDVDFALQPSTRIFGRITLGPEQQPVAGQVIHIGQLGSELRTINDSGLPVPEGDRRVVRPQASDYTITDANGRFEFFVGPGRFHLRPTSDQLEPRQFTISTETELEFNFQIDRPVDVPLSGLVVAGDPPRPVSNATVDCIAMDSRAGRLTATTDTDGRFEMTRQPFAATLHAASSDGSDLGVVAIGPDDESATIVIQPQATARGRLLDGDTNAPLANAELEFRLDLGSVTFYNGDGTIRFGGRITTNEQGEFILEPLSAGADYQLRRVMGRDRDGRANRWQTLKVVGTDAAGEVFDLGAVVVESDPDRQVRKERIRQAFDRPDSAAVRYQNALRDIRIGHLRMLLIVADPEAELAQQFFQVRFEDEDVRAAIDNYWLVSLPLTGEKSNETFAFAGALGLDASDPAVPVFVVIDEQEQRLATVSAAELSTDGAIDKQKVLDLLAAHVPEQLDAQVLFEDALARAKAENKRVFLQESATWCGPCWMLSRFIAAHRDVLDQDYIFVKLDHRWPHAQEISAKFQKEQGGIPWCAILDANQNILATSDGPDGNIGFPSKDEPQGIEHFLKMLRDSRIRLTDGDLDDLRAALEGKE